MSEILYTVGCTFIDAAVAERWLSRLREEHLADVCAGGATGAQVVAMDGATKLHTKCATASPRARSSRPTSEITHRACEPRVSNDFPSISPIGARSVR